MKGSQKIKVDADKMVWEFILDDHSCVMAQSAVADGNITVRSYKITNQDSPEVIIRDLAEYIKVVEDNSMKFQAFIAVFSEEEFSSEIQFENSLWKFLNSLNQLDEHLWGFNTSPDSKSLKFSFSLLTESFYIVAMHPNSSKYARSSPVPMIVFYLHSQFELSRDVGRYTRVRNLIRKRDRHTNAQLTLC